MIQRTTGNPVLVAKGPNEIVELKGIVLPVRSLGLVQMR
jgi:hypothetical protein